MSMNDIKTLSLRKISGRWDIAGDMLDARPFGGGHINDTFLAEWDVLGETRRYVHQRINSFVFREPERVLENVWRVCKHLESCYRGKSDGARRYLGIVGSRDGGFGVRDENGDWWRCHPYLEGSVTPNGIRSVSEVESAARLYGLFLREIADMDADEIHESIPHFHDTPFRLGELRRAVLEDDAGRVSGSEEEIAFAFMRERNCGTVQMGLSDGSLPFRITHNDTKMENVLFDAVTGEALCVIDLDTVMPGSVLFDVSDLLRSTASTGAEDIERPHDVDLRMDVVEAVYRGFMAEIGGGLCEFERELLAETAPLMAYECGVRFLSDYLRGDVYFRTSDAEHNLRRARAQFALVSAFERHMDEIEKICGRYSS